VEKGEEADGGYDVEECQKFAAMQIKKRYDQRHKPVHFSVADQVYLRLWKGYNIPANNLVSRKLGQQYVGPLRVLERISRLAYRLKLPPSLKNVHLEPAPVDVRDAGDHMPTTDDRFPTERDRFDVEAILDKKIRLCGRNRKPVTFYLIRWKNAGPEHDEWVHKRNAVGAENLISEFEARRS
jgi:hypothetical protein